MFDFLYKPTLVIENRHVIRKAGIFYREGIAIEEIVRVIAVSKNAFTHEETVVVLHDAEAPRVWMSEFDRNFSEVIEMLGDDLQGMISPVELVPAHPFEHAPLFLWEKRAVERSLRS